MLPVAVQRATRALAGSGAMQRELALLDLIIRCLRDPPQERTDFAERNQNAEEIKRFQICNTLNSKIWSILRFPRFLNFTLVVPQKRIANEACQS